MYFIEYAKEVETLFGYGITERVAVSQTPFQTIEIYQTTHHGYLMVIDGFVMLTTRDNYFYHEVMGHSAIVAHPNPKDILIIGGGDCGTLAQVLTHPCVESATQVDIDSEVTRLAHEYFPELTARNNDLRAHINTGDGVRWLHEASDASYDIIIIDSTDPIGPGEGLFNLDFHKQCFRALRSEGIIIQQSESPLFQRDILDGICHNFHQAGFHQNCTLAFPQPCYPSGLWSATLACKDSFHWEKGYERLEICEGQRQYLNRTMLQSLVLQSSCWPSAHVF